MRTVLALALIGLLLVLCGWPLIRADAVTPNNGRALLGYTLGYLGVILILVAAGKAGS